MTSLSGFYYNSFLHQPISISGFWKSGLFHNIFIVGPVIRVCIRGFDYLWTRKQGVTANEGKSQFPTNLSLNVCFGIRGSQYLNRITRKTWNIFIWLKLWRSPLPYPLHFYVICMHDSALPVNLFRKYCWVSLFQRSIDCAGKVGNKYRRWKYMFTALLHLVLLLYKWMSCSVFFCLY
jgi:hypothetical protein